MASLTTTSSPISFQLRLGFKCRKCKSVFLRMNFPKVNSPRILTFSAGGSSAEDGDNREQSWTPSGSSKDSFSGWLDKDSGNGDPKQGFGGIMGAGLAGLFLAAGVMFASLSLKRGALGPKSQIKPLTAQMEVLLANDDQNENVDKLNKEGSVLLPDEKNKHNDSGSEHRTGTDQDSFSPMETAEDIFENMPEDKIDTRVSSLQNVESNSNAFDVIHKRSSQEDVQISPALDDILVTIASNPSSPELLEPAISDFSSNACRLEDSHSIKTSYIPEAVIELKDNLGTVEVANSSLSDINSVNVTTDSQEGKFRPVRMEHSKFSSVSSPGSSGQVPSDPSTVDSMTNSVLDVTLDSQVEPANMLQAMTLVSSQQDSNLSEMLLHQSEGISSAPEGHNLSETGPTGATSTPVLADLYENESDMNGHSEINRSGSLFKLLMPESSFSYAGIPAPSLVSAALQVPPGKVVVPAVVDQVQGQALAALQVLKVIEADVQPTDLCTRREYARWLVSASSVLSRNTISKVYPAMYVENVTELAFDDVTPEDPDFPAIQGLAEAGLISSKLSRNDAHHPPDEELGPVLFSPESPLSRQDLVSWKMALEKRQLPDVDKQIVYELSGYIDIDKIHPDAWPAIVADLSATEHGITALAFGFTRLFQPNKPVTKAQAAIALATGDAAEVVGEELTCIEAESMAETAVAAHSAIVAQVENDLNASFERELSMERERIDSMEKLAEDARLELEKLRAEKEEENNVLMRGQAAVETEMEVLARLRLEVEQQLQNLLSSKTEIAFERARINNLRKEAENENRAITQLQYELEVERKALSMARAWAEDEAKRAREQAKALEEARERWERNGIKVVVEGDLRDDANTGVTWLEAGKESPTVEAINRGKALVARLKVMSGEIKGKSSVVIEKIVLKIEYLISVLKQRVSEVANQARNLQSSVVLNASRSVEGCQQNATNFGSGIKDGAKRLVGDCREGVEKITQKFKSST